MEIFTVPEEMAEDWEEYVEEKYSTDLEDERAGRLSIGYGEEQLWPLQVKVYNRWGDGEEAENLVVPFSIYEVNEPGRERQGAADRLAEDFREFLDGRKS